MAFSNLKKVTFNLDLLHQDIDYTLQRDSLVFAYVGMQNKQTTQESCRIYTAYGSLWGNMGFARINFKESFFDHVNYAFVPAGTRIFSRGIKGNDVELYIVELDTDLGNN